MFSFYCSVKERSNILSHNLWSGGEYTGELSKFYPANINVCMSNEFASIGEYSMKLISNGDSGGYVNQLITDVSEGTYTVSFDCYLPYDSFRLRLINQGSTNTTLSEVLVFSNDSIQHLSLSAYFTGNIIVQILNTGGFDELFIDNLCLIKG